MTRRIRLAFDPLSAMRQAAMRQLAEHFNAVASANAHDDMAALVAIAKGAKIAHPIEIRDRVRAKAAGLIAGATSEAEINNIVMNVRAGQIVPDAIGPGEG